MAKSAACTHLDRRLNKVRPLPRGQDSEDVSWALPSKICGTLGRCGLKYLPQPALNLTGAVLASAFFRAKLALIVVTATCIVLSEGSVKPVLSNNLRYCAEVRALLL